MEQEKKNVPTGISPKLPEPPSPVKSKPVIKRDTALAGLAGVLLLAVAAWFIIFAARAGRSPAQVINESGDELFVVQKEIAQVSLPGEDERSVLFYVSGDALACALLQRTASGYHVLETSGHLPLDAQDKQGIWMAATLKGNKKEFLVFGLLFGDDMSTVKVDGEQATVLDTGEYRCWFYYGEGLMSINSESVVYS